MQRRVSEDARDTFFVFSETKFCAALGSWKLCLRTSAHHCLLQHRRPQARGHRPFGSLRSFGQRTDQPTVLFLWAGRTHNTVTDSCVQGRNCSVPASAKGRHAVQCSCTPRQLVWIIPDVGSELCRYQNRTIFSLRFMGCLGLSTDICQRVMGRKIKGASQHPAGTRPLSALRCLPLLLPF